MSKNVEIISGNFTEAGNFSGYDDERTRYFASKRAMESHKWTKFEDIKFPFFAKVDTRKIGQLDDNGDPLTKDGLPVLVDRDEILAIFDDEQSLIDHEVRKASLGIKITAAIRKEASAAGFSEQQLNALANASV